MALSHEHDSGLWTARLCLLRSGGEFFSTGVVGDLDDLNLQVVGFTAVALITEMVDNSIMNAPTQSAVSYVEGSVLGNPGRIDNPSTRWRMDETDSIIIIRDQYHFTADPQPDDWLARIMAYFRTIPDLASLGPKRLEQSGLIGSMGEFLIHPKGFHHVGQGQTAVSHRFPEEVDLISTGLLAVDSDAYHHAGGLDHLLGDLAMVDLGLKLRMNGGRCVTISDVAIIMSRESSPHPSSADVFAFHDRWGFDWMAADLDDVRSLYEGTGLMWNVRFWGCALPFEKYVERPALHWNNYVNVEPYRKRADHLAEIIGKLTPDGLIVDLGCGDGLFSHILALRGWEVFGIDPEEEAIKQACEHTGRCRSYPCSSPRFEVGMGCSLPLETESAQTVFMLDVIEHLPNPIRILTEAARVLKPGGHLFVTTPAAQFGGSSDPVYHITEYTAAELERQITAVPGLSIVSRGSIKGIYRDILLAARKQ